MAGINEAGNIIELLKMLRDQEIPENKHIRYVNRFLEQKARKQGIPLSGSFELTPLCNLDCKMCYVHLNNSQYDQNQLLDVQTWKRLIKQAYEAGMRIATLTGGECLTYPGFDEVYLYLYRLGIVPNVMSNGILIGKERAAFFKRYPPKMIQVTVYGSCDDAYEKVTGHRVFQLVHRNLLRLKNEKIPVKMSITPNSFMRDDIKDLLEFLQETKIPYNINANLIPPRKETGRITHDLSVDEYVDIFKYRIQMNHKELSPVDLAELPDESHAGKKKYGFVCGAGKSSFGIKYDGSMCPCLSFGEICTNAIEGSFQEAWKYINIVSNNYPIPEECGNCVYFDRCLPCAAMHKNASRPGHCDTRICERTKKLTSAGFIPVPGKRKESM